MKKIQRILTIALLALIGWSAQAQQVNTLYFLENAPMRHVLNPALMPVSNGYINFTPLGYTSMAYGMPLTFKDAIYKDANGQYITALYSAETQAQLLKSLRRSNLTYTDFSFGLLNFGFRIKENGYFHFDLMLRGEAGFTFAKPTYLLGGQAYNSSNVYDLNISRLGANANTYVEAGFGYAHKINEQWTVGGKLKLLLGAAYANVNTGKNTTIQMSKDAIDIDLQKTEIAAGIPFKLNTIPSEINLGDLINGKVPGFNTDDFSMKNLRIPAGVGAAIDLGMTYKPHEQVQITAAVNDLGFIYWMGGQRYRANGTVHFEGVDSLPFNSFKDGTAGDIAVNQLKELAGNINLQGVKGNGFARMATAKLNIGVDANFWENRVGIGVLSQTRFYNNKVYEEVTLGGSFRPVNWFNLALTYSLVENGKYSNFGAGISLMPYDGINMTLAVDYIPTRYTTLTKDGKPVLPVAIPSEMKGFNLAMGFSIVWGTNKNDKDKDGVKDNFDMCPKTPKNVKVDALGCPIDTDGDGVPDYLDHCPYTPVEAYGLIDEKGCPIDSDGDGVPDYLDKCPNTPEAAYGKVDSVGCPLDSDGDGVPDYLDECPDTPAEAIGYTDEKGCLRDTDKDGVPDYKDQCPNTPAEAVGYVDSLGCPMDTDGDSIPDYMDECPNTPAGARGFVDAKGCELDTDGDGVPDWKDECPTVPGLAYNKGCPEVKKEIRNLLKKAMQGIQFETGKATILRKSYPLLDQIAQTFIENENYIIEVQGHTDNVGKAELNKRLSDDRAHSVMDYLVKAGVPAERMSAHGYGMDVPIADNSTKAGRAQNRRVEFNITFEEVTYETILEHVDSTLYQQHIDTIGAQAPLNL